MKTHTTEGARIMAVADVFDAVSQKRCYREEMSLDEQFEIIRKGIGTDFDLIVAQCFLNNKEEVTRICEDLHKKGSERSFYFSY